MLLSFIFLTSKKIFLFKEGYFKFRCLISQVNGQENYFHHLQNMYLNSWSVDFTLKKVQFLACKILHVPECSKEIPDKNMHLMRQRVNSGIILDTSYQCEKMSNNKITAENVSGTKPFFVPKMHAYMCTALNNMFEIKRKRN